MQSCFRCVCAAVREPPLVAWPLGPVTEGGCCVSQQVGHSLTLSDLPLHTLNSILYRLSDGWDIVTLGQVTPALRMLSEDRRLWKALCQYHFAEKQVSPRCRKGCPHLATSGAGFPGVPLQNQKCSEFVRSAHAGNSLPQLRKLTFRVLEPRFRTQPRTDVLSSSRLSEASPPFSLLTPSAVCVR